ncbi:MAG: biopolymer transporter ExbD [Planctomycetes bacterium]|nr:biopolymer transporter ExbD [Planctomycetota bacterium]
MTRGRPRRVSRRAGGPGGALRQWEMHFGPNMTPMVDVVMVILIFFMAGTAVIAPELFLAAGLPADPSVQDAPGPTQRDAFELPAARFTLRLSRRSGRTVIDGLGLRAELVDALGARLRDVVNDGSAGEIAVLIQPDSDVPFSDVVAVHDRVAAAGVSRIGLLESPPR